MKKQKCGGRAGATTFIRGQVSPTGKWYPQNTGGSKPNGAGGGVMRIKPKYDCICGGGWLDNKGNRLSAHCEECTAHNILKCGGAVAWIKGQISPTVKQPPQKEDVLPKLKKKGEIYE